MTLIKHIDREKAELVLGLIRKEGPLTSELPKDIEIVDLMARRVSYALPKLYRLLREKNPDIVLSILAHLNFGVMIVRPLLPRRMKFVARETSIPSMNIKQSPYPRLFSFLYRNLYPRFDTVICQSKYMLDDLSNNFGLPRNVAVVINNPVDLQVIEKLSRTKTQLLPQGKFSLLSVGNLKYLKGFDQLLKALAQIENDDVHLTILGEGREDNRLKQLAIELGLTEQVTFAGFVKNPYPYMAQADLFVLGSRSDSFPNVVLESMACGTPVVAFECPGGISEIIEDGINGWKVEPENTAAFAKTVEKSIQNRWNRDLIKSSVETRFSVKKIVREYENVLFGHS